MSNPNPTSSQCPYCENAMRLTEMTCDGCQVSVTADFPAAPLAGLPVEHQRFIEMFVLASGNLKEIAALAGVSYPTVRSRLDKVIASLRDVVEQQADTPVNRLQKKTSPDRGGSSGVTAPRQSPAEIIKRI